MATLDYGMQRMRQRGVSLVELMVSMTIGLVILAALVALFVNSSASNRELGRANSLIESGRLAIELLKNDVLHAGYLGPYMPQFDDQTLDGVPTDMPTAVPDPCLPYSTPWSPTHRLNLLHVPVAVYDSNTVCSGVITDRQLGTDILVVRHAELCVAGSGGNCEDDIAGNVYIQSSRCPDDLERVRFGAQSDTTFDLLQRDCLTVAEKRKFISNIYYVRNYAVTSGDGIPTLVRSTFTRGSSGEPAHQQAVPMVEGIQAFRVEVGIDNRSKAYAGQPTGSPVDYTTAVAWLDPDTRTTPTNRGDGTPDGPFVHCPDVAVAPELSCPVDDLMNVTAVKIYVLARSREADRGHTDTKEYQLGSVALGPFNDGFKRHVYVATVRMPNIAGRRQTP